MGRQATGLLTAPPQLILARLDNCNLVMRVGAFPEVQSEKAALGESYRTEFVPVKAIPAKSVVLSQGTETMGVTRPLQSLAVWQCRYTSNSATILRTTRKVSVGATSDPRYGCSVNMVERDSRLSRLHQSRLVALSGREALS